MSQKRSKLINRYLKTTGMDATGESWKIPVHDIKGIVVGYKTRQLRDSKRVRKAYKEAPAYIKKNLAVVMATTVNINRLKQDDKTKKA